MLTHHIFLDIFKKFMKSCVFNTLNTVVVTQ